MGLNMLAQIFVVGAESDDLSVTLSLFPSHLTIPHPTALLDSPEHRNLQVPEPPPRGPETILVLSLAQDLNRLLDASVLTPGC